MNKKAITRGLAIAAVLALGAAPAALAERPADAGPSESHGQSGLPHGNAPTHSKAGGTAVVMYVFKGTYAGAGSVVVDHGNAHVKKAGLLGQPVSFDLSTTTFVVADTTGDSVVDANDVVSGDRVVVKSRLPRKDPGLQPFAAKQLVDQTHAPAPE
jgi:hypothetical protein